MADIAKKIIRANAVSNADRRTTNIGADKLRVDHRVYLIRSVNVLKVNPMAQIKKDIDSKASILGLSTKIIPNTISIKINKARPTLWYDQNCRSRGKKDNLVRAIGRSSFITSFISILGKFGTSGYKHVTNNRYH